MYVPCSFSEQWTPLDVSKPTQVSGTGRIPPSPPTPPMRCVKGQTSARRKNFPTSSLRIVWGFLSVPFKIACTSRGEGGKANSLGSLPNDATI